MANILSPFVLGQAVGVTCSGLFAFGTLSVSPFNAFSAVERSSLSVSDRSKLVTELLHSNGRKAFLSSVLVGSAAYLTAFIYRPATTSLAHSRVLHGAAIALLLAVPHTLVVMLPVYARLADVEGETKEAGEERWKKAIRDFYPGNAVRAAVFGGAYLAGLFGLALTNTTL